MTVNDIDVRRNITEIIAKKYAALKQGLIDQAISDKLDDKLERAMNKAENAGEDPFKDWVKYVA